MSQVDDWVVIDDFTPGIHSDFHQLSTSNSTAMPRNGAATVSGTWRCCTDRTGALVPLPRRTSAGIGTQALTASNANGYPGGVAQCLLLDALVMGPVLQNRTSLPYGAPGGPDALYFLYGVLYDATVSGVAANRHQYVVGKTVPLFPATSWDYLFSRSNLTVGADISYPSGSLDRSRFVWDPALSYVPGNYSPRVMGTFSYDRSGPVGSGAMSAAEQALTNFENVTHVNGNLPSTNLFFPNPAAFVTPRDKFLPGGSPVRSVGNAYPGSTFVGYGQDNYPLVVGHQGRFVAARRSTAEFYGGGVGWFQHDVLSYTPVGDVTGSTAGFDAIFGEENPSPISGLVSMSANELLILKHQGGATLVRGDLANPQVVRYPFVHSTGGYVMTPARTPFGVFYGTRDGVIRWNGGDTSELVSRQLDGPFWVPQASTDQMEGHRARFGYWHPWVMVPNGYLLHTDTGAWWRLDDPADVPYAHSHYDSSSTTGRLYAFRHKVVGLNFDTTPNYDTYQADVLAATWQWKSQPLIESLEREVSYGEIEILAQRSFGGGPATFTVTLTGFDATGTEVNTSPMVITMNSNSGPQLLRFSADKNFRARFVQIRIAATSGSSSVAAPKLFSVRLGRRDAARPGRAA